MNTASTVERRVFDIRKCLGRGGFGEVYLATMTSAGGVRAEVAIKVLVADVDPRSQAVERLRDEGRLLGALNHPAILRIHDIVLLDRRVALVTEYIDGADLSTLFVEKPGVPKRALVEIVGRVADALHAAWTSKSPDGHELRLVHRDIKPQNIRIGRHGDVKLLDFGIARASNDRVEREAHTQTNVVVGSVGYLAIERLFSSNTIDSSGDVFSLGCVLFEGLLGEKLFHRVDEKQMYRMALDSDAYQAFLDRRFGDLADHADVKELVSGMLQFDPATRPTAHDVAVRCEQLAEELSGTGLKRWCRERAWREGAAIPGLLDGQVISEATLAKSGMRGQSIPAAITPLPEPKAPEPAAKAPEAAAKAVEPPPKAVAPAPAKAPEAATKAPEAAAKPLEAAPKAPDAASRSSDRAARAIPRPAPKPSGTTGSNVRPTKGAAAGVGSGAGIVAGGALGLGVVGLSAIAMAVVLAVVVIGMVMSRPAAPVAVADPAPPAPVSAPVPAPVVPPVVAAPPATTPVVAAPKVPDPPKATPASKPAAATKPADIAKTASGPKPADVPKAAAVAKLDGVAHPVDAPRGSGSVAVTGGIDVKLVPSSGSSYGAGSVPSGHYDVRADFGSGFGSVGSIDVRAGSNITIRCSKIRQSCSTEGS